MADADGVELGFLVECQPWAVESRLFPSKVGGKPAWLSLENLPKASDLQCPICEKTMIFLCQIYAPSEDENFKNYITNFHRTIFIFVCRTPECCNRNDNRNIRAFRSNMERNNKFYPFEPPTEEPDQTFSIEKWATLCNLCGSYADKKCSNCKMVYYCSRDHQVFDWKEAHKNACHNGDVINTNSKLLFLEWEVITEPEEIQTEVETSEQDELKKFEKLKKEGKSGTLSDVPESDLEAHANVKSDIVFLRFQKRIAPNPDQVIRYEKGGQPLWIAEGPVPKEIPVCEYCGGERQFEFQIMPQILSILKENSLDFGVICIYTCKNSCVGNNIYSYKNEFVFKQDVELNSL